MIKISKEDFIRFKNELQEQSTHFYEVIQDDDNVHLNKLPTYSMSMTIDQSGNISEFQQKDPSWKNAIRFKPEQIFYIKGN